jgi:hypothetical protein
VFGDPAAVGASIAIVSAVAALLTIGLLWKGCGSYRASLVREQAERA